MTYYAKKYAKEGFYMKLHLLQDMAIEDLERRCLDVLEEVDAETVFNILDGN
jgi:hypothetical protein